MGDRTTSNGLDYPTHPTNYASSRDDINSFSMNTNRPMIADGTDPSLNWKSDPDVDWVLVPPIEATVSNDGWNPGKFTFCYFLITLLVITFHLHKFFT